MGRVERKTEYKRNLGPFDFASNKLIGEISRRDNNSLTVVCTEFVKKQFDRSNRSQDWAAETTTSP